MKYVILALLLVGLTSESFAQAARSLTGTKVNSINVLVSASAETVANATSLPSDKFSGQSINGRKIVVGCSVTDSSAAAAFQGDTYDVDLEGSFDGTNFFTVDDAVINDKALSSAGAASLVVGSGVTDLASYNLPWYRLKFIPSATIGIGGRFKFYVSGLN